VVEDDDDDEDADADAETASIVSASYAEWRSDALYSPFEDIRQNLFAHLKYAQLKNEHRQPS